MARDLNNFLAEHRKSHTRYINSVDSLIERYENVSEDEMESVVNLSSCKIVKDKKSMFSRVGYFGSMFHHLHDNEKSRDYKLTEKRGKRVSLSPESERGSNTDQRNMDFKVLKDVSSCVVSFLEEGEPEPSDAETISSTSTDSYETILSEFEDDTTQESNSQEGLELAHMGKPSEEENIYDEIDGSLEGKAGEMIYLDVSDGSRKSPPCLHTKSFGRERKNTKDDDRRNDETFVVEDHRQLHVNGIAKVPNEKMPSRDFVPGFFDNSCKENCNQHYNEANKRKNYPDVTQTSKQRMHVKRISTEFTPFSNHENWGADDYVHELRNRESHSSMNKYLRVNTKEDSYAENTIFSSKDNTYPSDEANDEANEMLEIKGKVEKEMNKLDGADYFDNGDGSNLVPKKQNFEWLLRKFSPKHLSAHRNNDLSPSHRKRGSRMLVEKFKSMATEHDSPGSNGGKENLGERNSAVKAITPFHHRQARKMISSNLKSSPFQRTEMYVTNSNEIEYESLHEDNRSSKKDSGLGTLHDESLTIDTPLYEEVPEVLTLENLDSFNKSMADQSSFLNVSVLFSDSRVEEKTEKVAKWLHDVSIEMEKETETSIDRKVDRISKEMCRNGRDGNRKGKYRVNRHRHSSAEMAKETDEPFDTGVSKSCQPLQKLARSNLSDYARHGDRQTLRGHRNLTQNLYQRLEKQKVADIMKMFHRKEDDGYKNEVQKQRHSEFSGKRLIETSNDYVYIENETDGIPTPPKSRRLNENLIDPFNHRFGERKLNDVNKCKKSPGHSKHVAGNYIEIDHRYDNPLEKQEVVAYMMRREFPKQALHDKAEIKTRQTQGKYNPDDNLKFSFSNQAKARMNSHYKQYQNVYNADEDGNERSYHTNVDRDRLQKEMRSPGSEGKSSSHRDKRHVNSPYTYHSNRYDVNQSYIRKLKQNSEVKEKEDGHECQYYAEIDEDSDEGYERNKNFAETFDYQEESNMKSRHRQSYRKETSQPSRGNNFQLNEKCADVQRYEELGENFDNDTRDFQSHVDIHRHYHENEYAAVEREMMYKHQGRGSKRFDDIPQQVKNRQRKSSERTDKFMYRETENNSPDNLQFVNTFVRNDRSKNDSCSPFKQSSVKERYSHVQDSVNDYVDDEERLNETNNASLGTEIKRYHMECHLGSPHWQKSGRAMENLIEARSPHRQRNNNASFREKSSPIVQNISKNQKDTGYKSPSTRQDTDVRYGGFKSPVVERAKHTRINKLDEYSPSASLAKMRLNTPKSNSEGRHKQYRRSGSRTENVETNDENYKALFYTRSCGMGDCGDEINELNENGIHKGSLTNNSDKFRNKKTGLETERSDLLEMSSNSKYQDLSSQRFVSLDQLRGMPLQFRIQQLEPGHLGTERRVRGRQQYESRECSNEYICENSGRDSCYFENKQGENSAPESKRSSNVYHKYCEVFNGKDQASEQSPDHEDTPEDNDGHDIDRNGNRTPRLTNEPKMRKSLFSPINANLRLTSTSQDRRMVLQSVKDFDVFKTPMSPPMIARNKLSNHNKENKHDVNKGSQQKSRIASSETTKPRDMLSDIYGNSVPVKMTPSQYMQSTPIKPGMRFSMNTTMSTIIGSDETEINNEGNEEIILI